MEDSSNDDNDFKWFYDDNDFKWFYDDHDFNNYSDENDSITDISNQPQDFIPNHSEFNNMSYENDLQANTSNFQTNRLSPSSGCLNMSLYSVHIHHPFPLYPKENAASGNSYNSKDDQIGGGLYQVDRPVVNYHSPFDQGLLQSYNTNMYNYPQMRIGQNNQMDSTVDLCNNKFTGMSQGKFQQCLGQQVSTNIVGRRKKTITKNLTSSGKTLRQRINKVFTKGCKNKNVIRREILIKIFNMVFQSLHLPKVTRDESRCVTDLYNNRAMYADQIMAFIHENLQVIKNRIDFSPKGKKVSK